MWIRLDCPNGHPVKVDEKFAGRMGRCPTCGEKIRIPQAASPAHDVGEKDVRGFVGKAALTSGNKPSPVAPQADAHPSPAASNSALAGDSSTIGMDSGTSSGSSTGSASAALTQQTRLCPNCRRKVSVRYQICPHCRTYMPITGVGEGSTLLRGQPNITNCPHCGVRSFPGATVCNNCGEPLS